MWALSKGVGAEMNKYLRKILPYFPTAHIYKNDELIVEPKNNIYFRIDNIDNICDFQCKILEWVSRPCIKGVSSYWQKYFSRGVNSFFHEIWTKEDFELIYTRLGNGVNRTLCRKFIMSNFDLECLNE